MRQKDNASKSHVVLIGTYTEPQGSDSEGVYVYRMDPSSGKLSYKTVIKDLPNVSFMSVHPRLGLIYAVNETETFGGKSGGGISVLSINLPASDFHVLYNQSSGGENPCYISLEHTGRFAFVANYKSGSIAMFPIGTDGRLSPASDVIQHVGASVHPERQTSPHPHCIIPDRENRYAIAVDLGLDKLLAYHMDLEAGKLHKHSEVQVKAGAGPRHLIFNSSGRCAYLINELNSTIVLYQYSAETASFDELQTVSTLPEGFSGENFSADLHLSLDEKCLYASNRGHDSIVCFNVDTHTGQLTYQGHAPSGGHEPRIFALDPSGHFLIAVHQKSNNVVVFRIDPITGNLTRTAYGAEISMPVHIMFGGNNL